MQLNKGAVYKMKNTYLSIAITSLVLGIMISAQYKSNLISPTIFLPDRWAELTIQAENLRNQHDALINEKNSLSNQLANRDIEAQGRILKEMLDKANIAAGLTNATGPGIIVTLDNRSDTTGKSGYNFTLQYWNILTITNELKSAGAEAISINNERIVATSEVCNKETNILVNHKPIAAPYKIKAIGNAETLESSLRLKGGEIEALLLSGVKVKIQKANNVEIPAYRIKLEYHYAVSEKI